MTEISSVAIVMVAVFIARSVGFDVFFSSAALARMENLSQQSLSCKRDRANIGL